MTDEELAASTRGALRKAGLEAVAERAGNKRYGAVVPARPQPGELARRIDHTLLTADATAEDVRRLCAEAEQHGFHGVCVNPARVALAREVAPPAVAVCSVVGFPLGAHRGDVKAEEARRAVKDGAVELDVVTALGLLREAAPPRGSASLDAEAAAAYRDDLAAVVAAARRAGGSGPVLVKAILETGLLTRRQVALAARLAELAGADFVKTSTGMLGRGAAPADVRLLRACVGRRLGVKASGGVRERRAALHLLRAGADRLGSSASARLVAASATRPPRRRPRPR